MIDLSARLSRRLAEHLYRVRRQCKGPQQPENVIDGKKVLSFCSNDYLGLANDPRVIAAFKQGLDDYGVGSGAAHLVNGHSRAHHALEEELAEFAKRERAILFSTGYMANLGITQALLGRHDHLFADRLNHASLNDAGQISNAALIRYSHNDVKQLHTRLKSHPSGQRLIMTDAVFSMDGDLAPLPQIAAIARTTDSWLLVDDAHGFGVLGKSGRGSLEHYQLSQDDAPVLMATLGKAVGTFGAFVAGSYDLIETLIQFARTYIYTTATPPALAQATRVSLKILQQEDWRREKLHALITQFRRGAEELGLNLLPSQTPIQPLIIGDHTKALALSQTLYDQGILVSAIRPPTVPVGTARLRITLSASHSEQQVMQLLDMLGRLTSG